MSTQDQYERIVAALYEAALDYTGWAQATHLIDDACGLIATHLVLCDPRTRPPNFLFSVCYRHGENYLSMNREYIEDYYPIDERIPRIFRLLLNRLTPNEELYTEQELKTSIVYNEGLPRIGSNNQLIARLAGPTGMDIAWAVTKPAGAAWSSASVALLQAVLPPLRHILSVHHALVNAEVASPTLAGLLDARRIGAVFLDWRGQILAVNDYAQALLGNGSGLSDKGGVLSARPAAANARLGKLLARVLHGRPPVGGSMTLKRTAGLPPLVLHVSPVTTPRATFSALATPVLVLLLDPSAPPSLDAKLVASALGLTPAESEVAVSLAAGHTVHDIAAATYRQDSSVRWLIKQLHAKLGLTHSADLVRRVLALTGVEHT
jgi:DNA-binding CsgD family transcriptional regulator